jgi:2-dehydropantoate 2-reductase
MMRIGVMGAGAVGAYFGAKLAAAGHDLAFITRGEHLGTMTQQGLRIISPNGNLHIKSAIFSADPTNAGIVDMILFCVKSYDTETAAQALGPMIGDHTTILSLQNGVDNPEKIARQWGERRTLAGVVYIAGQISTPGVMFHSAGGKIIFGQLDGGANKTTKSVAQTLVGADIASELSRDIQKVQWTKLLWNAPFCAISCLIRANMKQIAESEMLIKLALDCMTEVQAAALLCGIELADKLLDQAVAFSKGLGEFKPSMLQDLEARKPLEFEALNGIVVKLLHRAGKRAPINQTFYAMLCYLDKRIREEASS